VRRALPSLTGAGDEAVRLQALRIRCWAATEAEPDSLTAYSNAGVEAASKGSDETLLAYLTVCRGYARESAGDELGALQDYEVGVTVGRSRSLRDLLANALVLRGETEYTRGDFRAAVQDLNEAYQLFGALGNPARVNYALNAMANLYADARMGQYDRALEYYRQLLAAHEAARDDRRIGIVYFNIAATLERMNRLDDALANYRRGLAIDQRRGDADEVATDRRAVGVVLYKLGRPADALRELEPAVAHFQRKGLTGDEAAARLSRGITLRMLKRTGEAIADLEFAHAHYRKAENRRFLEKIHEERAIAYADAGRVREAYDARVQQLANQKSLEAEAREEQSARLRVQFGVGEKGAGQPGTGA
jgi:tetratricopeptide (TPR) repeat protein